MYKGESLLSTSTLNSTNGKERVSQVENSLLDPFSLLNSEKAEQETSQQLLCQGLDIPLIKFSEALTNLTKALRQATVEKASAKAEAADWKHKYEIERARNLQLEQKGHCFRKLNVEGILDLEEQGIWSNENRKQSEMCSQNDEIIVHEVLQDCEPDFESPATGHIKMVEKASFKLEWYCKGEKSDSQKHGVVSFKKGNISTTGRSSKQISLKWKAPPQTVLILTKPNSTSAQNLCLEMVRWLKEQKKLHIIVEPRVKAELLAESSYYSFTETWKDDNAMILMHTKVDLVVTLGGDGTVLWAASMFKGSIPPIVPFSVGSLGFMTPFDSEHYCEYLDSILDGPFNITLRHRLQCRIIHENGESKNEGPILVLNEVTIDRGIASFLTNLECYCDNSFVTRVQGDGLILSTTSGSTAYSLSAGGSMVHPQVPGILFTPICPHSLSFRPLILPENVVVTVTVPLNSRGGSAWASFDGKDRQQLVPGDSLVCSMAAWPVPTACVMDATDDFLRSIHDNLHWNLRQTQASDGPCGP